MTFRRTKSTAHARSEEWAAWKDQHKEELASIDLPATLYADEGCWTDFLENGHLHWHQDPWAFEFTQLSEGQMAALLRFLEREYGRAERCPPLLSWVRVRCAKDSTT